MKPRKLRIKGLNSFIDSQEIDFEKLTDKGLFGIFGPTGSGKSTILDAITIALYGKIARESDEFINTECSELSLTYEFEIGNGTERKCYIVDRNVKRDKHGRYKTSLARLRDKNNDMLLAEAAREVQNEIEKIIGLTCEDFTRSVVLPQGKFSEFLKLSGRDRRDMLERIFGLEKYGKCLWEKIKKVRSEKLKSNDILTGELKQFENVSEEVYENTKSELRKLNEEEKILRHKKNSLDNQYEKYKTIWELQQELEQYKKIKIELDIQEEDINNKRIKLKKAQGAFKVKPYIDNLRSTEEKLRNNQTELISLTNLLETINNNLIIIESKYKDILQRKDKEIPELITKEANLLQALDILVRIDKLKNERTGLLEEYHKLKNKSEKHKTELDNLNLNKLAAQKNLEDTIEKININRVEPEYREKIQAAVYKEDEYNAVCSKIQELKNRLEVKEKAIITLKNEYDEVLILQNSINCEIQEIEGKRKELEESFPGDNSILLQKQNILIDLSKKLNEAIIDSEKKKELEIKISALKYREGELTKELKSLNEKINKKEIEIEELEKEILGVEKANLAGILAADLKEEEKCPVCGSKHHPQKAIQQELEGLEEKKQLLKSYKTETDKLQLEARKIEVDLGGVVKQIEFLEQELKLISKKLEDIDIVKLQNIKELSEKEFNKLKEEIEIWNSKKSKVEESFLNCKDKKSDIEKREAKLNEGLKGEKSALKDIEEEYNKTFEKFNIIEQQYLCLKNELKNINFKEKLNELKKQDSEVQKLQKLEKILREELEQYEERRETLSKEISVLEIEITKVVEIGKEKKTAIEDYNQQLGRLSEGKDPEFYLEQIRKNIKEIKELEESLRLQFEKEKNEKQHIENKIVSGQQNKITLNKILMEQSYELENALAECELTDREEAINSMLSKEDILDLEKLIKSYEDRHKNVIDNIIRIQDKLRGNYIQKDEWNNLLNERAEISNNLDDKLKEIAKCQQTIDIMEKNLKELKELLEKKKELEHMLSLLDDLDKLIQGNKFVEFVAMNQLKYISFEASKRLKDITRGRYALELDSSGNFTMRDDFNGGVIRATNTLSGGETFLTSLALALSLSSQIQLKGSAPLEFFFLDEGFGTLDSELLEIVISSLERLHNDRLSVGIISHVEELKNRVPVKLIVEPAQPGKGGSKVKIEYS
ncbi:AAA family ATPase [Clostridium sp. SYSU_GA19001]|uniref:AAA family ATPase n=1 Tax=Clostridium caldaquaticum TaxID=2940653 RepID=UPI0020775D6F|nr:AAA family ATPase [Clostridium caldaquaticum]MCM8709701.1 AAA family ATPase [Clostridium caldaquaticum]